MNKKIGLLSRFIMDAVDPQIKVDHINHDILDNRRSNLRLCTHAENCRNRRTPINNTSGYTGVYWAEDRNCWRAQITYNKRTMYLGSFSSKTKAAKAYNRAAKELFGKFACLNIIDEDKQ
jgi:hypothetical protein